jgi:glycosyltransferase involved in cell wall biosynthesis
MRRSGLLERLRDRLIAVRTDLWVLEERFFAREPPRVSIAEATARALESLRLLANHYAKPAPARSVPVAPSSLVSIIMPVYNREERVRAAIRSVLAQTYSKWELLVIDDGSTDGTRAAIGDYLRDPRIHYRYQDHLGHSAARNRGLQESRGEIVAYLDSDNTWYRRYLETIVGALEADPERHSVYLAQLVRGRMTVSVRILSFDRERLEEANYIDLNVFAHRRRLVEELGGFDESLTRLVDWDLILRYTTNAAPLALPVIGGRYEGGHSDRITVQENCARNAYLIRRKRDKPLGSGLRVLYAVWHYPQLTESYIRWEIACMRRWGVHVEVWSQLGSPPAPFASDVPIHHGCLAAAIARVRPHLVHVHWLHSAVQYGRQIARAGLPLTVRAHGFEVSRKLVATLERHSAVRHVYLFPHMAQRFVRSSKVRAMSAAFNGDLFYPSAQKDKRLVLRAAAGLRSKDLQTFFDVARRCRSHRFVLVLGRCNGQERYLDELVSRNRALGNLIDLRINLDAEDVAALTREAGIYLHTHGLVAPYGMPVSIAEAMATGSYVLGRRCPAAKGYIGGAGHLYDDAGRAAELIQSTLSWSDERWRAIALAAVERAYRHYCDHDVFRPMLMDWLRIAGPLATAEVGGVPLTGTPAVDNA